MVLYYGQHRCKQHIRGKPIHFGYKLWSACTPAGYLIQFIPYQGSKFAQLPEQQSFGLGAAVVLQLLLFYQTQVVILTAYFSTISSLVNLFWEVDQKGVILVLAPSDIIVPKNAHWKTKSQ